MARHTNRIEEAANKIILKYYPLAFGILFMAVWCISAIETNSEQTSLILVVLMLVFVGILIWVSQNIREYNNAERTR